jgi:hypothetical protein
MYSYCLSCTLLYLTNSHFVILLIPRPKYFGVPLAILYLAGTLFYFTRYELSFNNTYTGNVPLILLTSLFCMQDSLYFIDRVKSEHIIYQLLLQYARGAPSLRRMPAGSHHYRRDTIMCIRYYLLRIPWELRKFTEWRTHKHPRAPTRTQHDTRFYGTNSTQSS